MNNKLDKLKRFSLSSEKHSFPIMTIYKNETFVIEQHYQLTFFSPQKIVLLCHSGNVEIYGQKLFIGMMYPGEIILKGNIEWIKFHTKDGEEG